MSATSTEASAHLATTTDLEFRVAKIADPHTDLRTKHAFACEIKEMMDTVRDSESVKALPYLIPALLELLRSGEVSLQKESMEYQFRRVLIEIVHRLPFNEAVRSHVNAIFMCMLHVLRRDNEENGVTACKILVDLTRNYRVYTEEGISELATICQEVFHNAKSLAEELLSEDSPVLDANSVFPSIRSFKVIGEVGMVMVIMSQIHRQAIKTPAQATMTPAFEVLALEAPAQHVARTNCEAMGGMWAGMAPTIKNTLAYADLISSQIKLLSYVAYVMRFLSEINEPWGETLILCAMRLLLDCPANGITLRKDLMVVFRHLVGTPHRKALLDQIDKLFDERVLLGTGIASKEMLRPVAYSAVADMVHHLRNELSVEQITRIVQMYSRMLHNPALGNNMHLLFAKMIFGLADVVINKDTSQGTTRLLNAIFRTCLERLEALSTVQDEVTANLERQKKDEAVPDILLIERERPVGGAVFATEKPEDVLHDSRLIFRTLLHGFRVCLSTLRKCDAPSPDGTLIFRWFEGCIRCMLLFDPESRINDQTDAIEWFGHSLVETNLYVFQEVWIHKIDFFFECAQKRAILLNVCQFLFSREPTSSTLLAIVLRYLVDRLPLLGEHDDITAAATIRLYKMAFAAVGLFPGANEPTLAFHLSKLMMDCFPLAAKASKPLNYFYLLRALFRAIGGGGGRFELLYKEVLPLLPDMLENLNRQLLASEGVIRDTIVELCLTVPLRLTHLLPHLSYLMQPLAMALRGNPESVSQGLRTLELCIDNLTPDFLDPTLSSVLRELMESLFALLKPIPANHHHAHTTIRILGKLGGRNRRLLTKEPLLQYHDHSEAAKISISFGGTLVKVDVAPLSRLATRTLNNCSNLDRVQAYEFLESCLSVILHEGLRGRNVEDTFTGTLEGIYDATHISDIKERAEAYLQKVAQTVFQMEIRQCQNREVGVRPTPSTLLTCFLDAIPHALAQEDSSQAQNAQRILKRIVQDLISMSVSPQDILFILHQIANRFTTLCLDDSWVRNRAGCRGIEIMTRTPDIGVRWITDRDHDLVRTLLHVLKDLPHDMPRDVEEVVEVLLNVLRISNADLCFQSDSPSNVRSKLFHLIGIFFPELQSSDPVIRRTVQRCFDELVVLSKKSAVELLMPHRDRMLAGIYTKPLRALPFSKQIGMIEAIRYCVSLDPPLVELNDEFLRLLHETLALADADDASLIGRGNLHQQATEITRLRIVCIKLLTASMPLTDFFSRQHQTRQRVTSVYFKSLYFPSQEVKEAAHEGLRTVLSHQSRLPKELLQTGLRPILTNLADAKRLSVVGLEGLARLLELLTNYFKVEIGHKLLDHFRVVADPQLLLSSRLPPSDNNNIAKLVKLTNVFHLLPAAASIFLEGLVNAVVQTEAQMQFSTQSPFSEPLAKYLNRYPSESVDFFIKKLGFPRNLRTYRSILQAKLAPNLERELSSRTHLLVNLYLLGPEGHIIPTLQVLGDLAKLIPTWFSENSYVVDAVLHVWNQELMQPEQSTVIDTDVVERHSLMLDLFIRCLKRTPRVDLLFDILAAYTRNLGMDLLHVTKFLYEHAALSQDTIFKRNILMRFLTWFSDATIPWTNKMYSFRYLITPILLVHAAGSAPNIHLISTDFITRLHAMIWRPNVETAFSDTDDTFKIELLHITTVLVQHYSELLEDARKDIIKCAWYFITTSEDTIVKQTAYLLAARFFAQFQTPQKFILRAWTGLLRLPHSEGRSQLRQEALATLAPSLPRTDPGESGFPQWAKTTRRLLAEEGLAQIIGIYHLIVKQSDLFYPVRSLFIPHMTNTLNKIGMSNSSSTETRLLTIDMLQMIFSWEEKAMESRAACKNGEAESVWLTPLAFRENMVSYLVRLATLHHEQAPKIVPRALALLQMIVGPKGWTDVTVGLRFFSRALELTELNQENPKQENLKQESVVAQALAAARVLQIIASEKSDDWYLSNASVLNKLVRKGLLYDDSALQDALHPIFDKLIQLYPLPKEDEEQQVELAEFHSFVSTAIGESLRSPTAPRGALLMLKSVVQAIPERIEPFGASLMKLLGKLAKDHTQSTPNSVGYDSCVRQIIIMLEISQLTVAHLGDQRKIFLTSLIYLVDKSKSTPLCRYLLDMTRTWTLSKKQEVYPTMKEKATILQKMSLFENRSDALFHAYLELIYDIYTEQSLRRSDLTVRLEASFLLGCRAKDPVLRERFLSLLDVSVPRSLLNRLTYVVGVQSWEVLSDHHWIYLALHLILGAADTDLPVVLERRVSLPASMTTISRPKVQNLIQPVRHLLFLDPQTSHEMWVSLFPAVWTCLSRREQVDITYHMINLLSKDYHLKQTHLRPNVIQTLLTGIHACSPAMIIPPYLVKYLAKMFGAWYVGLQILEASMEFLKDDDQAIRDYVFDSLADLYAELAEEDLFYGLWRRRSLHEQTNIALAYEQCGMWEQASSAYETAQSKVRAGAIPYSENEYCLWEDHWILSTEKLQHWDLLHDLAKGENNNELILECAWRTKEWADNRELIENMIAHLPETPTPRRRVFEAFIALLKNPGGLEKNTDFTRYLEDAMQLSLRKWISLPTQLSAAHVPLLEHFQQFVELQEAVQIYGSLSQTNAQNLEKRSSELKMVLQAWRERLPNVHDDINIWSDLVAWRQNVFHSINKAYIPLINGSNQTGTTPNNSNTYGYRGYHETAWIINRFAHVARKHGLLEVCFSQLNKIYTLPNIEISEAFLKLREQARCHYQKPNDLQAGLEVINNTNLMFFSGQQKAEFYTMKAMFHARLGRSDEANFAFGQAVQLDTSQPKAWAEWGKFNDRMFKENPTELSHAANAVSCYLQAAGLYKSFKSRPLLARILWLLSVDDNALTISRAFDTYKGEAAFWYWITLIPQLCLSLSHREAKQARYLLNALARHYPQAVFYQMRTAREEMQMIRKAAAVRAANLGQALPEATRRVSTDQPMKDATEAVMNEPNATPAHTHQHAIDAGQTDRSQAVPVQTSPNGQGPMENATAQHRQPWEYVDEILQVLKTSFPLLILSLETMIDQIQHKFKLSPEEDIYRNICMLIQDAAQNYMLRMNSLEDDGQLSNQTVQAILRMSQNMPGPVKKDYEEDFLHSQPNMNDYIKRLQDWRDRYEKILDLRARFQPLAVLSPYLTEFHYNKVDEIEVPGQYTEDKDNNQNFVRIQKFAPKFEYCRTNGSCWKRFTLYGHDNSKTSFTVQLPCHRQYRREDRVMQILRIFNTALARKKESRKRNLAFHIPAAVSCSPNVRLFQTDTSYISMNDIYERFCSEGEMSREEPILYAGEKTKKVMAEFKQASDRAVTKTEYLTLKKEIYDEVAVKLVPDNVLFRFMSRSMHDPCGLWKMRKQFALQLAACCFMTYAFCLSSRHPNRFHISRATGQVAMTELLPGVSNQAPVFATSDVVPFRYTPNMQAFIGPIFTEGILASGIMAIARCLTDPEFDLEQQLCLLGRDEVTAWLSMRGRPWSVDPAFRKFVAANIEGVVQRAETMACKTERDSALQTNANNPAVVPVLQTVTSLISSATNPLQLAKMGELYHPWF